MKVCSKCKNKKELDCFNKNKTQKDGYQRYCKKCKSEVYQNRIEKRRIYSKNYLSLNPVQHRKREWNKENWKNNKKEIYEVSKKWRKENREKVNEYQRAWRKRNYYGNINYKILEILRSRFWGAIKNENKSQPISLLIGCDIKKLKLKLEFNFKPEMNWKNHGEVWEIDHIKPCISFDLTKKEEQKECFHYSNLQPLFKTTKIAESFGYKDEIGNRNK